MNHRIATEDGCGIASHSRGCNCDVDLDAAAERNDAPRIGPMCKVGTDDGLWNSRRIADALKVGHPYTADTFLLLYESVTSTYDLLAREGKRGEAIEGEMLRIQVCDLLRTGVSMTTVASALDLPLETIMRAMTNGVSAVVWSWDETQWLEAEAIIHGSFETHSGEQLAAMLGVHHCVIDKLAEWYGVTLNVKGKAYNDLLNSTLLRGLNPHDAAEYLATLGITVSPETMYNRRKRLVESGEVSSVIPKRQRTWAPTCAA